VCVTVRTDRGCKSCVGSTGNPNDKVLFARCRSVPGRLERRHSLRLWGSARRLHRSGSSRSLPRRPERSDTSSSAEYASTDSAPHSPTSESLIRVEGLDLALPYHNLDRLA
jgi:hypothetical protein